MKFSPFSEIQRKSRLFGAQNSFFSSYNQGTPNIPTLQMFFTIHILSQEHRDEELH